MGPEGGMRESRTTGMQSEAASAPLDADAPVVRRASGVLMILAAAALAGNCLLNSPGRFSKAHEEDRSLLRPVVSVLALGGAAPTVRGVEIRDLFFYLGAAALTFVCGLTLLTSKAGPRMSVDDLLDFRARAGSPIFWWFALLLVSGFSSLFSHAPDICKGQTIIRLLQFGWWLPLALLLTPRHARRLAVVLLILLAVTAALGVWYQIERPQPRLKYPMGNELFLAACLLPGVFLAVGLGGGWLSQLFRPDRLPSGGPADADANRPATMCKPGGLPYSSSEEGAGGRRASSWVIVLVGLSVLAILTAIGFTRSRSAAIGLVAGLFTILLLTASKRTRPVVLLASVLLAIGGAMYLQHLRVAGVAGSRAHSIRQRLDHEWPCAIALFYGKPIAGRGDGAYSMLAGQFAREDQLDDPAILSFDEWSWPGNTHNEFLELLCDLGVAGAFAFLAAIVITVLRGLRFCDRLRSDPARRLDRWLVIGLTGAFMALVFEECSDVALRAPGLPPIFLTIWAVLYALVREERRLASVRSSEGQAIGLAVVRLSGLGVCVVAALMAWWGAQDWRASRAFYDCQEAMKTQSDDDAIAHADFAEQHTLAPFGRLIRQVYVVWTRSVKFDALLAQSEAPPTDADLEIARQALVRLESLKKAAPRFLKTARLEADLSLNLSRAHARRGESPYARNYQERFLRALEQHRADEPFRVDVVEDLWKVKVGAGAVERLLWLRSLLRNGEMDGRFLALFNDLVGRDDLQQAMADLVNLARQDAGRPAERWTDRLSPETLRITALHLAFSGRPDEAVRWAAQAEAMYQRAGPRLFAAHSAALHEMARYRFDADPIAATDENLNRLALAQTIFASPVDAATALPDSLGQTRLRVLLAAGREEAARAQARLFAPDDGAPVREVMARGYLTISAQFADRPSQSEDVLRWLERAEALMPAQPESHFLAVAVYLRKGDDAAALMAAESYLDREKDRPLAFGRLVRLEERYAGSSTWSALRQRHPDFPPPMGRDEEPRPASAPAAETAGSP